MQRRELLSLLIVGACFGTARKAVAQPGQPTLDIVAGLLKDDKAFESVLRNMWLLREILVFRASPEQPDYTKAVAEFSDFISTLQTMRMEMFGRIEKGEVKELQLEKASESAEKVRVALNEVGVEKGSKLSDRLVSSYVESSALLEIQGKGFSWCDIFPFDEFC